MKREQIEKQVVQVIADVLGCDTADIAQSSQMVDDLGADSIDGVEILMQIEGKLGVELPDQEYYDQKNKIRTVKDICDLAEKYVNQ